jgi:hypothetical protein
VIRLLLPALWLVLAACPSVCPEETALLAPDGGPLTCVQSTDCPRPSNVLVCTNSDDKLRDCVGCVDTLCKRFIPRDCQ